MKVDLHIHSHYSDGVLSVDELIALARDRALKQFSITDHDTLAAYTELAKVDLTDLRVIAGCEFSSVWNGRTVHVLGLNLDLHSEALDKAMQIQNQARQIRAQQIADTLEASGFPGALEGAQSIAANGMIGRPHFAKFLQQSGYVKDEKQAFKKYLGAGKAGDIKAVWRSMEEVISWIVLAGGVPILAHPEKYKLTHTKLRELLTDFKRAGGLGMEVVSGKQQPATISKLADLSNRYALMASIGSDFHRPGQSWADLGNIPALPQRCDPVWRLWN